MVAHDLSQSLHAIHARHFEVECHYVGPKLFNFLQAKRTVHRCADNFNLGIPRENAGDELAHQRRVVDHEYPHFGGGAHAVTASAIAGALPSRATTVERFRMRTTFPSPRIEAPLTRSVAARSSSKA